MMEDREIMRDRNLPNEVLENIFAHLPVSDLLLSKCLVSKQWNAVISREAVIFFIEKNDTVNLVF